MEIIQKLENKIECALFSKLKSGQSFKCFKGNNTEWFMKIHNSHQENDNAICIKSGEPIFISGNSHATI